jgi:hypothetical protein
MAMKSVFWLAPALLFVLSVGCGKAPVADLETTPSTTNPAVAHESQGDGKTPVDADSYVRQPVVNTPAAVLPVDSDSTPEKVVTEFLNAMKTGNDGVAAGLLTATAREETAKHSLAVQPPGSETAQYEIGEGELSEDDPNVAQVGCLWTEKGPDGADHSEQVVWVLRKHTEGWRVFGMATQMPTRPDPVFFNFEDPAEMTELMEMISQEMAAAEAKEGSGSEEDGEGVRGAAKRQETENSLRR